MFFVLNFSLLISHILIWQRRDKITKKQCKKEKVIGTQHFNHESFFCYWCQPYAESSNKLFFSFNLARKIDCRLRDEFFFFLDKFWFDLLVYWLHNDIYQVFLVKISLKLYFWVKKIPTWFFNHLPGGWKSSWKTMCHIFTFQTNMSRRHIIHPYCQLKQRAIC